MAISPSRAKRALISLLSTSILAGGLVALAGAPASAVDVTYNVVDRNATTGVTADSLPTTQIDGVAWDQAIVGDTVYAGGQFSNARPAGAAAGTQLSPRSNLLSYNIRTGVLNAGFAPTVNGRIRDMALSPDKSRLYIAGAFTSVNGQPRSRVAAFNTSDGSLVSTFAPVASSDVFSVAVSNTAVYLGGWFGAVNGVARQRIAAVNPTNGATLAWAPTADSTVNTMTLTPDKSRLIVGGNFANLNGSPAIGMGSLDAASGTLYPFAANQTIQNYGNSAGIYSLVSDATNIYGVGYWFGGTGNFEGVFVADPTTGAIKSMADCHGDSYDVTPANGVAYAVSHHHDCSNMNGFPDTDPRNRWMRANAFTIDATTTTGPNTMGGYYSFQGQPSSSIINWFPDVAAGTFTGQGQAGWTIEATNEYVVQGGEFPLVNNLGQQGLARFAIPSIAPNKQGPRANATDSAPTVRGVSASSVRVSWKSNYDRDDQKLTYRLYRSDRTATPLVTQTVTSQVWNRPTQLFTDTGLTAGTAYGYYVTATDPNGNTLKSNTTTITAGATVVDNSAYAQAVAADGAAHYWRLDEKAGETSSVDWAGGNDLRLGTGVTNGAAGAVNGSSDTAASFDGTGNGTAAQSSSEPASDTFTAEAWFKTTSTSGGKILGFGNNPSGNSNNYDRHVYMSNDGRLTFGVHPGGVRVVSTADAYNNGDWHHVVATLSSGGMQLYVDGLLEGFDPGTTAGQGGFTGYWRVGGDNLGGWPNGPTSHYLAGTIDDVAIYPTALSSAKIRDHYTKSGRTVNLPVAPSDAYGKQVYGDEPLFYWRLNEASGTTVADASPNRTPGNVFGGVTLGSGSTVAPGTAATFNGANGTLSSARTYGNPTAYSEEIWFNTTTGNGGKLIGFGDQREGFSGNYDRHVYMENSGQLTFGVWTGQTNLITSPTAYNDGGWHHLVATQDATNGMKMYVDGALVGTNPQTSSQSYTGYWRVGGDSSWGGNSAFFNGSLDEAAVYPRALTEAQVKAHYTASGAAVNAAPVASFTTDCTDATCAVDGRGSSDDGSIASYAWDFGDDATATGATATHSYAASGTYTIRLTVTDNAGKTATTTKSVTVVKPAANQPPAAAFTSDCTALACSFDGSTSTDADGTLTSYAWNFGDATSATGATASHTYAANGTYTVTLTVTDDRGDKDSVSHVVSVSKANAAPTAAFTSTVADLRATFDASGSDDADGTIAAYAWTFGDGTTGTGAAPSHTYATAGSYDVTLKVTDNLGAVNEITKPVTVTAAAPVNAKPVASFTSSAADLNLSVNGSGSTDSDGTVASYAWDFGDGGKATGATASRTYAAAGSYTVTLTVTDDDGATDTATKTVTVTAAPPATNVVAQDAFTRTGSRWGTADVGGAWTDSGATNFSTSGGKGLITVTRAGSGPTASLNTTSALNTTTTAEFSVDKVATGSGLYVVLSSRKQGTSEYRVKARLMSDGTVRLNTTVVASGTETLLRETVVTGLTYAAGDVLKLRADVSGSGTTSLSGKIWKAAGTEPAAAQISSTNTVAGLQTAGAVAVQGYLSGSSTSAPVVVALDNLLVSRN